MTKLSSRPAPDLRSQSDRKRSHALQPGVLGCSWTIVAVPPSIGIFMIRVVERNPSHLPSGEKNGRLARSVPSMG